MANVRAGDTTDISALYVESLNDMSNMLATRIVVAVESRLPIEFWIMLYVLVALAMIAVGYQTAIANSQRTWMLVVLALSFSIVIVLIAALDDPERGYIAVSQRPLYDFNLRCRDSGLNERVVKRSTNLRHCSFRRMQPPWGARAPSIPISVTFTTKDRSAAESGSA